VTVLNGSGVPGQAADAAGALGTVGFHILDVDSYPGDVVPRTTVRYGYGTYEAARLAARHITGGAALVYDPELNEADDGVVVVTGSDFTTIHDQPAPEGSPDDRRITTTTVPDETTTTGPGGETTTTTVPTTTTTVIGYSTGEPPDGVDCG